MTQYLRNQEKSAGTVILCTVLIMVPWSIGHHLHTFICCLVTPMVLDTHIVHILFHGLHLVTLNIIYPVLLGNCFTDVKQAAHMHITIAYTTQNVSSCSILTSPVPSQSIARKMRTERRYLGLARMLGDPTRLLGDLTKGRLNFKF